MQPVAVIQLITGLVVEFFSFFTFILGVTIGIILGFVAHPGQKTYSAGNVGLEEDNSKHNYNNPGIFRSRIVKPKRPDQNKVRAYRTANYMREKEDIITKGRGYNHEY